MEVSLDLGASLDIASGKELSDHVSGLKKDLAAPKALYLSPVAAGTMPASGPLTLKLGRPPVGRLWTMTGITTAGVDDATTTANAKVAIYFGDAQNLSLAQLKIPALTVPFFDTISDRVLWVHSNEDIIANITGAAAGSPIVVIAHVSEYREQDIIMKSGW